MFILSVVIHTNCFGEIIILEQSYTNVQFGSKEGEEAPHRTMKQGLLDRLLIKTICRNKTGTHTIK